MRTENLTDPKISKTIVWGGTSLLLGAAMIAGNEKAPCYPTKWVCEVSREVIHPEMPPEPYRLPINAMVNIVATSSSTATNFTPPLVR